MQSFEINPLNSDHYLELINIWEKSVRATHHFLTEDDVQFYKPLILNEYFRQVQLFGITDGQILVGFIGLEGRNIQMLFLDPDKRGKGFGKLLVHFAMENFAAKYVDVNEQNEEAVGFYRHLGFSPVARYDHDAAGKPYPVLSMALA